MSAMSPRRTTCHSRIAQVRQEIVEGPRCCVLLCLQVAEGHGVLALPDLITREQYLAVRGCTPNHADQQARAQQVPNQTLRVNLSARRRRGLEQVRVECLQRLLALCA